MLTARTRNENFLGTLVSYGYAFTPTLRGIAIRLFRAQLEAAQSLLRPEYRPHRRHQTVLTGVSVRNLLQLQRNPVPAHAR